MKNNFKLFYTKNIYYISILFTMLDVYYLNQGEILA